MAAGITGDSYLHPAALSHGFNNALLISAIACTLGGLLAALTIRNPPRRRPRPSGPELQAQREIHCCLDAPPLRAGVAPSVPARTPASP